MKQRDITVVMKRIKPWLQKGGVKMGAFERLEWTLGFAAPEIHPAFWRPLCEWLAANCPNPTLPGAPLWVREVSDIVEGRK